MNILAMAKEFYKERLKAAFHESGHAIMCLHLGKHFDFVEVIDDQGQVVGIDPNLTELAKAKISLAGPIAENIHTGLNTSIQFTSLGDLIALKDIDQTFLRPEVQRILEKNWSEVESLAKRLVKQKRIYYSQIFQDEHI